MGGGEEEGSTNVPKLKKKRMGATKSLGGSQKRAFSQNHIAASELNASTSTGGLRRNGRSDPEGLGKVYEGCAAYGCPLLGRKWRTSSPTTALPGRPSFPLVLKMILSTVGFPVLRPGLPIADLEQLRVEKRGMEKGRKEKTRGPRREKRANVSGSADKNAPRRTRYWPETKQGKRGEMMRSSKQQS